MSLFRNTHLFHKYLHAFWCLLLQLLQDKIFDYFDFTHGFVSLIVCVKFKVLNFHIGEGLSVESLYRFHVESKFFNIVSHLIKESVGKKSYLFEHFESEFEDTYTGELFPDLKIFLLVVVFEVINFTKSVVNSLFLKELLKLNKLHFFKVVFSKTPFWYDHVLMRVSIFEFYDFPVIRVERTRLVHVTKLFWHFPIYPTD